LLEEFPLEVLRRDLADWAPAGIIELARLGIVEPPPQRQRIIVNPRFENPQAKIRRAIVQGA
jgi:hypothetical protein